MFVGAGMGQSVQKFSGVTTYSANTANLDGSTQYFNGGNDSSLHITGSISVCGWFKPVNTAVVTEAVISKHGVGGVDGGFLLTWNQLTSKKLRWIPRINGTNRALESTGTFDVNEWHFVVCTYDASTSKIYVDGVLDSSLVIAGSLSANTANDLNLGRNADTGGDPFEGGLANWFIYDTALTAGQVTTLYNEGDTLCYTDTDQTDMVSFYSLENHIGFTSQEQIDQHGSNNLTNIGSTPFTGTGLVVECADDAYFLFTVNTALAGSASDTIVLPFTTDQNLSIDWGEGGATEDITTAVAATHTYASSGIYNIRIRETAGGYVKYLKFNTIGDKAKLLDISSWDSLDITETATFYGCANLTVSATNLCIITSTDLTRMFRGCTSLTSIPLLDTSNVTSTADMFRDSGLTSIPLLDLSSSLSGLRMFKDVTGLISVPNFNLSSMTNCNQVFSGCTGLTTIGFTRADAMTSGASMFLSVTLDTADWSDLLIGLAANNVDTDCILDGGSSLYNTAGGVARSALIARTTGWTITDGGVA